MTEDIEARLRDIEALLDSEDTGHPRQRHEAAQLLRWSSETIRDLQQEILVWKVDCDRRHEEAWRNGKAAALWKRAARRSWVRWRRARSLAWSWYRLSAERLDEIQVHKKRIVELEAQLRAKL